MLRRAPGLPPASLRVLRSLQRAGRDDRGSSEVLGAVLMVALTASMLPMAVQMMSAQREAIAAEREVAQQAAYCARNPGLEGCEEYDLHPSYDCELDPTQNDTVVCTRRATNTTGG